MKNFLKFFLILLFVNSVMAKMKWDYEQGADTNTMLLLHLDEGAGTACNDVSGQNNTGTAIGVVWVDGLWGKCINSDGATDRVECGNDASLILPNGMTLSVWIKTTQTGANKRIISKWGTDAAASRYLFQGNNDKIDFYIRLNTAGGFAGMGAAGSGVNNGKWHYLVGTWDGLVMKLYIDGIYITSAVQEGTLEQGSANLTIGADPGGAYGSVAEIEEVKIRDKAWSAGEIWHNFTEQSEARQ